MLGVGMETMAIDGAQKVSVFYGAETGVGKFLTKTGTTGGTVKEAGTADDVIIGVSLFMQNNINNAEKELFAEKETGMAMTNGVVNMVAGGVITEGDKIECNADGNPIKADETGVAVNAIANSSAKAGELVEIKLNI